MANLTCGHAITSHPCNKVSSGHDINKIMLIPYLCHHTKHTHTRKHVGAYPHKHTCTTHACTHICAHTHMCIHKPSMIWRTCFREIYTYSLTSIISFYGTRLPQKSFCMKETTKGTDLYQLMDGGKYLHQLS